MADSCPVCGEPPFHHADFDSRHLGVDEDGGRFGEVSLERCRSCGRLWLRYLVEVEGFTSSGRWYRGAISEAEAEAITPADAIDYLGRLEWHFLGGSYYRSAGMKGTGEIRA